MLEFLIASIFTSAIGGGLITLVVVAVLIISFALIMQWLKKKEELAEIDDIAFTIAESLEEGNCKVVRGIFNTKRNVVKEAEVMESSRADKETKDMHRNHKVVIYN